MSSWIKDKFFYSSIILFALGNICAYVFPVGMVLFVFLGSFATSLPIIILLAILNLFYKKYNFIKVLDLLVILFFFFSFGFLASGNFNEDPKENEIHYYNSEDEINFSGYVYNFPEKRSDKNVLDISVQKVGEKEVHGLVRVYASRWPEVRFGDVLNLNCDVNTPQSFEEFDYKNYLARYNIHSVCFYPKVEFGEKSELDFYAQARLDFLGPVYAVRQSLTGKIGQVFPEPVGSFVMGIITGQRKEIPKNILEDFQESGVAHIIAISGLHITILIGILAVLLRSVPKKPKIVIMVFMICGFVLMVGASASAVRAAVMGGLALIALTSHRQADPLRALFLIGLVMILISPKILMYDVGFQLSFLASLGLILISPLLKEKVNFLPKAFGIRGATVLTLSAQIMAVPIVALHFDYVSLIAPVTNVLILPFVPFLMLFAFLGTLGGFVSVWLGKILGLPAYLIARYVFGVTEGMSNVPFASTEITHMSPGLVLLYYGLLGLIVWRFYKYRKNLN